MNGSIASRIEEIKRSFPEGKFITLVAVSKFQPEELVKEAYDTGQLDFGESRVQEIEKKAANLPSDIRWHFIGHLQTNKVSRLLHVSGLHLIQSVDSFKLLEIIDKEAEKLGKRVRILMEVHVANEETKSGFSPEELVEWFHAKNFENLKAIHICGIMGMATNTDDIARITADFTRIRQCYEKILSIAPELIGFDILSMGMSGDYGEAIKEGANMVRIGSYIFGERRQ